ncbi:hypothetical protein BH09CHL1_BH09CHL1_25660 [soil metagenome]
MSSTTAKLVFGRVPVPEGLELRDIVSEGPNTAFDRLGVRRDLGTCTHRMVGSLLGTHEYFQGEARDRSLTDFGIGGPWDGELDGAIYQWVPKGLEIAPWANGPENDLDGDGVAFVQALGIGAVNRDLRSIELSDGGDTNNPYGPEATPKQFNAHVALVARIFDQAEVPWDQFPLNPNVGVVTYLEHWEIGPKECPFPPVREQVGATQAAVRGLLKLHQTGVGTTPDPIPVIPSTPVQPYSASLDQAFLRELWGEPKRIYRNGKPAIDASGRTKTYPWDPRWTPCSAWIHRAREEKEFPKPGDWETVPTGVIGPSSMIPFSNGWVLLHFPEQGWKWAE